MATIAYEQVQGIVFSGYRKYMSCCSYYLLRIDDATKCRAWIRELLNQDVISHGGEKPSEATRNCLNLAIAYPGLEKMQLAKGSLYSFELSFRERMDSEHRSALLGDRGINDPSNWHWGNASNQVDLLLALFSKDADVHAISQKSCESDFEGAGLTQVRRLDASPKRETDQGLAIEHFGFADGISDPVVEGFPTTKGGGDIAAGEFLLGYPNQYGGKETQIPISREFGANGTYLVLRQLKQDVAAFWQYMSSEAERQGVITADYLAAKIVGRWKSGAVVEPGQDSEPNPKPSPVDNGFTYVNDPDGFGCPFGSHIRRSNPRGVGLGESEAESLKVANRHRILRRGRSYGSYLDDPKQDDGNERGLIFICLNANIERQFEFVQHTWTNSVKFAGLYTEDDPLIGSAVTSDRNFSIPEQPLRRRICGFQQFVTMRGGSYFFLPSLLGLGLLARDESV